VEAERLNPNRMYRLRLCNLPGLRVSRLELGGKIYAVPVFPGCHALPALGSCEPQALSFLYYSRKGFEPYLLS
jgi:hypothetical protein